jgi:hypothetical protein
MKMASYSAVSDVAGWRDKQSNVTKACSGLFDHYAGVEVAIFEDCVSMAWHSFEELLKPRVISSISQHVAFGIACHAYQLLLSAWQNLREGRLVASCDHWRSIAEAPDYVLAAAFNEDFAQAWADLERATTVRVENARRIVRRELNRRKQREGDEWATRRAEAERELQRFSHVTVHVALLTFLPGSGGAHAAPEGAYRPQVKQGSQYVALLARELMVAIGVAFERVLSADWMTRSVVAFERARASLDEFANNQTRDATASPSSDEMVPADDD